MRETAQRISQNFNCLYQKRINVILCSDYKVRKLNKEYRHKDRNTDVLSFCFDEPDFLGEIYISLQRAQVQARKYTIRYDDEINRLFVHGVFHLLGYRHDAKKDREIMEMMEKQYH